MHLRAKFYTDQIDKFSDELDGVVGKNEWSDQDSLLIESIIIYSTVICRKLWEHYGGKMKFELSSCMAGLQSTKGGTTYGDFLNKVIHSREIRTSSIENREFLSFKSDRGGDYTVSYRHVSCFLRDFSRAAKVACG